MKKKEDSTNIYFHRDLLCYSLDELRVDLITITSTDGMTTVTEPRLPGLFPDLANNTAYQFKDKKVCNLIRMAIVSVNETSLITM